MCRVHFYALFSLALILACNSSLQSPFLGPKHPKARFDVQTCSAGVKVQAVEAQSSGGAIVRLEGGKCLTARKAVVVATDGPAAQQLLGKALSADPSKPEAGVGTCCLYFRSVLLQRIINRITST